MHPAVRVPLARLPDESGVPVGVATRLGGGAEMRPLRIPAAKTPLKLFAVVGYPCYFLEFRFFPENSEKFRKIPK